MLDSPRATAPARAQGRSDCDAASLIPPTPPTPPSPRSPPPPISAVVMRRDVLRTTVVLGGTLASAVLVSLAGAARAPDVDAPLPPPPQTAAEAEGMGLFAAAVDNKSEDDDAADGVVALYASSRAELRSALVGLAPPALRWRPVMPPLLPPPSLFFSFLFLVGIPLR